jgi:AraC family transcriptional regulator of arabinose operon
MVEEYIQKYYNKDIKLSDLCNYVHVSRTYLSTLFKKIKGVSIKDYITTYRINRACDLLISTELSVTGIALRTGFNNSVSFYRQFRSLMIASPRYYRMKNRKFSPRTQNDKK